MGTIPADFLSTGAEFLRFLFYPFARPRLASRRRLPARRHLRAIFLPSLLLILAPADEGMPVTGMYAQARHIVPSLYVFP